jgi:hypothetical protein
VSVPSLSLPHSRRFFLGGGSLFGNKCQSLKLIN